MKKQFIISKHINPEIKKGDKVRLIDGSGLTCAKEYKEQICIVFPYEEITGSKLPLRELTFTVTRTGIKDLVCSGVLGTVYLQDIELEYNGVKFYNCSKFVSK